MTLNESYEKYPCEECDQYTYVFEIKIGDCTTRLCKKCLLNLLKLIIER